jgi:predicted enzyme related to lactoylglutathione lyase
MSNPVVHFEMPYRDRDRIVKFYEAAFGWTMNKLGPEMGNYVVCMTSTEDGPKGHRGAIDGGFFERRDDWPDQYPSVVIAVPDVRAAMKKVKDAGGEVLGEPMQIPGVGDYVSFRDTEGNRVSMLQPLPMA